MQKNTTTALLLPGISPDLSWIARALHADRLILDDLHQFQRKSRIHRMKVRTGTGQQWLTLPLVSEDRHKPVNQVRIASEPNWVKHFLKALEYNYRKSPWYDFYEPEITEDITRAGCFGLLIDVVLHLMQRQWMYLELPWRAELASGLPSRDELASGSPASPITAGGQSPSGIIWQEADSRHYQRPHPQARPVHFPVITYRQHFGRFVHGCSLLDVLFEYGPESWQILDLTK